MPSIAFFSHDNQYHTKATFVSQLAQAFERAGWESLRFLPRGGRLSPEDGQRLLDASPNATLSFNCIEGLEDGRFLWDITGIPHVFWNLDPAIYILDWTRSPRLFLPCVDQFDVDFLFQRGFERASFLPHASDPSLRTDPKRERPYDVVLLGSCYDHMALRQQWQERFSPSVSQLIDDAIDLFDAYPGIHFLQALTGALRGREEILQDSSLEDLAICIDYFIRGRDRLRLLQGIEHGQVHVFGDVHEWTQQGPGNWSLYKQALEGVQIHPAVSYLDALKIMKQSKICLNSSPQFLAASHERICNGLLCGAAVLSNSNRYLEKDFPANSGLALYSEEDFEESNARIGQWLEQPQLRYDEVQRGSEHIIAAHSWDRRVESLIPQILAMSP
jgi:hypothetical protein